MPLSPLNRQPEVSRAAEELRAYLQKHSLTQTALAKASGVPQYQINRLLNGRTKKFTRHVATLCHYANIYLDTDNTPILDNLRIQTALKQVWDGRRQTIEILATIIESARPLLEKVELRQLPGPKDTNERDRDDDTNL